MVFHQNWLSQETLWFLGVVRLFEPKSVWATGIWCEQSWVYTGFLFFPCFFALGPSATSMVCVKPWDILFYICWKAAIPTLWVVSHVYTSDDYRLVSWDFDYFAFIIICFISVPAPNIPQINCVDCIKLDKYNHSKNSSLLEGSTELKNSISNCGLIDSFRYLNLKAKNLVRVLLVYMASQDWCVVRVYSFGSWHSWGNSACSEM